jgi:hypothetical protein
MPSGFAGRHRLFETAALSEESGYFDPGGESESGRTDRRIQKKLFATANAAASLVDYARRVHKLHPLPDYDAMRTECFGADGLHEFVIGLRVALHHLHALEAGSRIVYSFSEGTNSATFVIGKAVLVRILDAYADRFGSGRKLMQDYINTSSDQIDLRAVFLNYRARVARVHGWMGRELESDALVALRDYDSLIRRKINADKLMFWKAMMGNWLRNWKTPPHPHKHLSRYLTPAQLDEVYKLPHNSKQQVDLVINMSTRKTRLIRTCVGRHTSCSRDRHYPKPRQITAKRKLVGSQLRLRFAGSPTPSKKANLTISEQFRPFKLNNVNILVQPH